MSTYFKNTATGIWKNFNAPGRTWRFDIYGVTPKAIEGSLEEFTCEAISAGDDRTATLQCTTEQLEANLHAVGGGVDDRNANLESTLANFTCDIQSGFYRNDVEATLEKLIFEGISSMGLDADLELFSCNMQSLFGASVSATIELIDLTAVGDSTFVSLEPLLKRLGAEMFTGVSVELELEPFKGDGLGFIENQGDLEANLKHLTFQATSGHGIIASLNPIGYTSEGSTPIFGTLNIKTSNFTCSMSATTASLNSLLAILRRLSHRASGTQVNPGEETTLLGTLKKYDAQLTGSNGSVADLEGSFRNFAAELTGTTESDDHLTALLEELTMTAISFTGTGLEDPGDCEPAATLEFGA